MSQLFYPLFLVILFLAMLFYFRIADHYNIIDHPNERSSHAEITIRGAGIIFLFAIVMATILYPQYWLPGLGALIIGTISFIDDRLTVSNRIRILFHLAAVTLIFLYLQIFHIFPVYNVIALYIIVIGIINMYNFMDGINGITGCYTLTILGGLQYINLYQTPFIEPGLIWLPMLACLVFLFYNFRKKARCFAGDVGSVTIAFWVAFLLLKIIFISHNWAYILFLSVYGADSVLTIIHRLILKQNIFQAHRLHFYQLLANEHKISQRLVSVCYAAIQLLIICLVIFSQYLSEVALFAVVVLPLGFAYLIIKPMLMRSHASKANS